jgi:hypothetical protein
MSDTTPQPAPTEEIAPARVASLPPKDNKPPRRAMRVPLSAALGALLIVALALVGTAPYWAPPLLPLLPWSAQTAASTRQSDQITQRLSTIEQQLGNLSALNNRLTALENKPAPDASAAMAPLSNQVQQLGTHLDQIDGKLAQLQHDEAANADSTERVLMIAVASLGNAVADSRPFTAELTSVEALGQNRTGWATALQPLESAAKTGLPSTAILAQRFANDTAPAILRAEAEGPTAHQDLWHAMLAKLRGLVIIRRIDRNVAGANPTDAAVEAAQAALDKGDLNGAVTALNGLSGAPATAVQPWLKDAQQRLAAEQTIAKLSQELAGELAAEAHNG